MRVVVLTVLIALLPRPAAADDGFRARLNDYVADHGGCLNSRALVERELVAFERGRAEGEPGSLALFGKLAAEWTGEDIGDLLAVIRACEALRPRPRPAEDGERRLAERLDYLAQAMRRAIVLSAQPSAIPEGSAPSGLQADAPPEAGGGPGAAARTGRRGQGPAFVPVDASRPAPAAIAGPDEGRRPFSPESAAAGASPPRAAPAEAAAPRREALRIAFAPGSAAPGIGSALHRAAALPEAPVVACTVTRERFERIRAGMTPTEVEGLLGCRGRLDSAAAIEGVGTFEVYVWAPPSLAGSVTVTFQDRRLKAKMQRGLI